MRDPGSRDEARPRTDRGTWLLRTAACAVCTSASLNTRARLRRGASRRLACTIDPRPGPRTSASPLPRVQIRRSPDRVRNASRCRLACFVIRWVEQTAELELEIEPASGATVFADALAAFAELADGGRGSPMTRDGRWRRMTSARLLVEWLSELVYLAEVERFIPERIISSELGTGRLRATIEGHRGRPRHLVKAVTLQRLELRQDGDGWRARVVLDVCAAADHRGAPAQLACRSSPRRCSPALCSAAPCPGRGSHESGGGAACTLSELTATSSPGPDHAAPRAALSRPPS